MNDKIKKHLGNFLVFTISSLIMICLVEWVFAVFLFSALPLKYKWTFPEGIQILLQKSKASTIPKDYITILGDSHAMGFGDWFMSVNKFGNPDFNVAHLIHNQTGRDVISFGSIGSASLRGLVGDPISKIMYSRKTLIGRKMELPKKIIFLFYEGNDITGNLAELHEKFDPVYDNSRLYDRTYFLNFIDETILHEHPVYIESTRFNFFDNFFVVRSMIHIVKDISKKLTSHQKATSEITVIHEDKTIGSVKTLKDYKSKIRLNNDISTFQSAATENPPFDYSEQELEKSLYMFDMGLEYLRNYYPSASISIAYIPSPAVCYDYVDEKIAVRTVGGQVVMIPPQQLRDRNERIVSVVKEISHKHNASFLDITPYFQEAAKHNVLHGPKDLFHPNRIAYEELARILIENFNLK